MLTSTPIGRLTKRFGTKEAIRIVAKAGFDAYDMTLCSVEKIEGHPLTGPDFRAAAQEIRAYADSLGLVCNQTHAVYPTSRGDERDPEIFETAVRHLEISAILGAKVCIVHPNQHLPYWENVDTLKQINMDFYRRLVPYCEKFGIRVALENMWQHFPFCKGKIIHSTCSRAFEFNDYLDTLNSPWMVGCLDIGHTVLVGEDLPSMIREMGPRIFCMHVHDVNGLQDQHTLPFHSSIDYEAFTQALADIGYQGDITLESDCFYGNLPVDYPETYETACAHMASVARALRDMINAKRV